MEEVIDIIPVTYFRTERAVPVDPIDIKIIISQMYKQWCAYLFNTAKMLGKFFENTSYKSGHWKKKYIYIYINMIPLYLLRKLSKIFPQQKF